MKQKDLQIISLLRKNSRESLVNLSKTTGVPVSTIFEKLKTNFYDIIDRYTLLIDFQKINLPIHVFVFFKVAREQKNDFQKSMKMNPFLNSLYKINNGFDFLCEFFVPSINFLDNLIDEVIQKYNVIDVKVEYITETLDREHILMDQTSIELLASMNVFRFD